MTTPPTHGSTPEETDVPPRYDCLCCDRDYLTESELTRHVTDDHDPSDVAISMAPVNIPVVARFPDTPEITTRKEALKAIKEEGRSGVVPDVTRQLSAGECPICGELVAPDTDVPVRMVPSHGHETWEWYQALRETVSDEYERSPTFDDAGYPSPAGTVMVLLPGDWIELTVDGWDDPVAGYVLEVDDPRTEVMAPEWESREVSIVVSNVPGTEGRESATLHPDPDGTVQLRRPGLPSVDVRAITRRPWYAKH
ncbi:hypothetical protein ACFQDD_07015 [Halorubrum pallidum]|uniref:C2H2-type domain-containing protein n=1 Tax=Halorubrum pallidum TaxID=1526114 RepID=A0ABD5T1B5_9EURY